MYLLSKFSLDAIIFSLISTNRYGTASQSHMLFPVCQDVGDPLTDGGRLVQHGMVERQSMKWLSGKKGLIEQ